MSQQKRALGRGLEALLPSRPAASASAASAAPLDATPVGPPDGKPLNIPVGDIERNPYQTRTRFDEDKLAELTASVAASGVIQPVIVRRIAGNRYQLIAGERRWLASQRAGKLTVPANVRDVSDLQAMEMTVVENLQRADLNPMEQARAYHRLSTEFHLTQEQMATRTGKDRASVSNFLRLLKLPESLQQQVEGGELSFGHARALLALPTVEAMASAAAKVMQLHLSVRATENLVTGILHPERRAKAAVEAESAPVDANVRAAEESLQRTLGLRVRVEDRGGRGRVVIEYASIEDFGRILETLGAE